MVTPHPPSHVPAVHDFPHNSWSPSSSSFREGQPKLQNTRIFTFSFTDSAGHIPEKGIYGLVWDQSKRIKVGMKTDKFQLFCYHLVRALVYLDWKLKIRYLETASEVVGREVLIWNLSRHGRNIHIGAGRLCPLTKFQQSRHFREKSQTCLFA